MKGSEMLSSLAVGLGIGVGEEETPKAGVRGGVGMDVSMICLMHW